MKPSDVITMAAYPMIYKRMSQVMAEVEPIAKNRKNTQQGYSFRGVDETYEALQQVLAKYGVFSSPRS